MSSTYFKAGARRGITVNVTVQHHIDPDGVHRFIVTAYDRLWCAVAYRESYFVTVTRYLTREASGWEVTAARYLCRNLPEYALKIAREK